MNAATRQHRPRSVALWVTACVASVILLLLVAAAAPAAAAERYVALGDSYSSGSGTRDYDLDASCQRSHRAYPALVAARRTLKLVFEACAGATTTDVLATQLSPLDDATRWVTITIGGNDVGFGDLVGACLVQGTTAGCDTSITRARAAIRDDLPARVDVVYREIAERAPHATVIVLGYPRLFTRAGCDTEASVSTDAVTGLNQTADLLRDTLRERVKAAGRTFRFKDAIPAFDGHGACSDHPWLNGLTTPVTDSYHPNRAGHRKGYAPLALRAIR